MKIAFPSPFFKKDQTNWPCIAAIISASLLAGYTIVTLFPPLKPTSYLLSPFQTTLSPFSLTQEEYSLYSLLLADSQFHPQNKPLVIEEKTKLLLELDEENKFFLQEKIPSLEDSSLQNFIDQNRQNLQLERNFDLPFNYSLIPQEKYLEFLQLENGWQKFLQKCPQADRIITLSRIGFNSQKTQALLSVRIQLDLSEARIYSVFFQKENGQWAVKTILLARLS